jgi:hypothetical protein
MKFWLCASALATGGALGGAEPQLAPQGASRPAIHEKNETLLAGLRPGRDSFAVAQKRFKTGNLVSEKDSREKRWYDPCSGRAIDLELDAQSIIQSITITTLAPRTDQCRGRRADFLDSKNWQTGYGVRMGDPQDRIYATYGEPNSSGPSVHRGHELELLFYQFDWAGSDVPQVMEVLCARDTGRVVQITLAFPSL